MSEGNGHGPDKCAEGHDKITMTYEELPDGTRLRHWICRRCHTPGSDPG